MGDDMTGYPEDDFSDLYDDLTGLEFPEMDLQGFDHLVDEVLAMPLPDLSAWDVSELLRGDFFKDA